jgi:hypothetical protein
MRTSGNISRVNIIRAVIFSADTGINGNDLFYHLTLEMESTSGMGENSMERLIHFLETNIGNL